MDQDFLFFDNFEDNPKIGRELYKSFEDKFKFYDNSKLPLLKEVLLK
ncbi:MAG: hypothetical protein MJ252_29795 [archaeon]|nr:hypothetical protein [archaeon]